LFQRLQADMQRLQPMHLIESASIPYLCVSAAATPAEPSAAEAGKPASIFKNRRRPILVESQFMNDEYRPRYLV
jgi:hypothetical protein